MTEQELTWTNVLVLASRYDMQQGPRGVVDSDNSVWLGVTPEGERVLPYSSVTPYEEAGNYIWQAAPQRKFQGGGPRVPERPIANQNSTRVSQPARFPTYQLGNDPISGAVGAGSRQSVEKTLNPADPCAYCGRGGASI